MSGSTRHRTGRKCHRAEPMELSLANIISIDDKLTQARDKKEALIRRRKIQAVQKVFQCTQCAFKCEKCGVQLGQEMIEKQYYRLQPQIPFRLCESCAEEYTDYINRRQGRGNADCYWHNDAWVDLWKSWIVYQGSIDRYLKSTEFIKLLAELKQKGPAE
jgi:hypothetical protein